MPGETIYTGQEAWTKTSSTTRLVARGDCRSLEDGFDFRVERDGGTCSKGASCTCNATVVGSIPSLSTIRVPFPFRRGP